MVHRLRDLVSEVEGIRIPSALRPGRKSMQEVSLAHHAYRRGSKKASIRLAFATRKSSGPFRSTHSPLQLVPVW